MSLSVWYQKDVCLQKGEYTYGGKSMQVEGNGKMFVLDRGIFTIYVEAGVYFCCVLACVGIQT